MSILKEDLEKAIEYQIYVNNLSKLEQSPFLIACYQRDYKTVKELINTGCNINELCYQGYNGLQHLIISLSGNILTVFNSSWAGLFSSISYSPICKRDSEQFDNFSKTFQILINNGIDINHLSSETKINALSIALEIDGFMGDYIINSLIQLGAIKKAFELDPSYIYEYQDDIDFPECFKEFDFSCWPNAFLSSIPKYIRYINRIKKHQIEVYCNTYDDGYKRSKRIIKRIDN